MPGSFNLNLGLRAPVRLWAESTAAHTDELVEEIVAAFEDAVRALVQVAAARASGPSSALLRERADTVRTIRPTGALSTLVAPAEPEPALS